MPLVGGAIVPHAPLLLETISGPKVAGRVTEVARAVGKLDFAGQTIVLVSPHGAARGIYKAVHGDLDAFGRPGVSIAADDAADLAGALREAWDAPALDTPVDHGIVTPLALGLGAGAKVLAVCVHEAKDGIALAEAVQAVAERSTGSVAMVASAHLSAALAPRAPIPLREEAVALEDQLLEDIASDVATFAERADDLAGVGGSCSAGPLAGIGHCFAGRAAKVLGYDRSFGVGYLVARIDV